MKRYNEIVKLHLSEIIPYENNPRRNDDAVDKVANSIREFGYVTKIAVDENNVIISGHTRRKALLTLHPDDDPVIEVIKVHDTPERIKALRIADNKVGEFATWDEELLDKEIAELTEMDMSDFGFPTDEEIKAELERKAQERKDYSDIIADRFEIIIECQSEEEQEELYNEFMERGMKCRVSTL